MQRLDLSNFSLLDSAKQHRTWNRSFLATNGNQKATVTVFSEFSTTRMSWKALVLAFKRLCDGSKVDNK